jgi:hypothetical protein
MWAAIPRHQQDPLNFFKDCTVIDVEDPDQTNIS